MKDALVALWRQFVAAGPAARWALGVVVAAALAVGGVSLYMARNPHFEVLVANLDDRAFNRALAALAPTGVRYHTTFGAAPHTIFVESSRRDEALSAIHMTGDFMGPARGISTEAAGMAAVWASSRERDQRTAKRSWEETELLLEKLAWVEHASVNVSGESSSAVAARRDDRRATAVVSIAGNVPLDLAQRRALANHVSSSTGVPASRVHVSDQWGTTLYDGSDANAVESLVAFERSWQADEERRLQARLDQTLGPGLAVVGISGRWSHVQQESVEESLEPSNKPRSERTRKVEELTSSSSEGGPVSLSETIKEATASRGQSTVPASSTNESEKSYAFGQRTTHMVAQPHVLEHLTISLIVDESIADKLDKVAESLKGWAGFDESRGDTITTNAIALHGLERDGEGKPVLPAPAAPPRPKSPWLGKLLEHGIEIVAAIAFLVVMARSLKSASAIAKGGRAGAHASESGVATVRVGENGKPLLSDLLGDDEVDLDLLARKHVEELLGSDPEKVSALLSRWALGEQFYAKSGAR